MTLLRALIGIVFFCLVAWALSKDLLIGEQRLSDGRGGRAERDENEREPEDKKERIFYRDPSDLFPSFRIGQLLKRQGKVCRDAAHRRNS